jgi:hypothetical protein
MDYDDFDDVSGPRRRAQDLPQSGLGIASFIAGMLALLMGVAGLLLVIVAAIHDAHGYGGPPPAAIIGFVLILVAGVVALIGTGLGISGLCQRKRRPAFAILGLCINGLLLLGVIVIVLFAIFAAVTMVG